MERSHLHILAGLNLKTPMLVKTLSGKENIWKNIISDLSETTRAELTFQFLEAVRQEVSL
jgi:mannose/fructose-specific phosphotransferase system component IIA